MSARGSNKADSTGSSLPWMQASNRSRRRQRLRAHWHELHKTRDVRWAIANQCMVASTREGSEQVAPSCCSLSNRAPAASGAKGRVEGRLERREVRVESVPRGGLSRERWSGSGQGTERSEGGTQKEPSQPQSKGEEREGCERNDGVAKAAGVLIMIRRGGRTEVYSCR
eukprot:6212136-Pleurochrysis_carterae.AAC.3